MTKSASPISLFRASAAHEYRGCSSTIIGSFLTIFGTSSSNRRLTTIHYLMQVKDDQPNEILSANDAQVKETDGVKALYEWHTCPQAPRRQISTSILHLHLATIIPN